MERGHLRVAGVRVPQAIEKFQPALADALDKVGALHRTPGWISDVRHPRAGAGHLDRRRIAEPAAADGRMAVVPMEAGWSDIGSWSALLEALSAGRGASLVASGSTRPGFERVLVHGGERLVVTVGLRDVIIVDTPDALLVCARDRAGDQAGPRRDRPEESASAISEPIGPPPAALQEDPIRYAWLARLIGKTMALYLRLVAATAAPRAADLPGQVIFAIWHESNLVAATAAFRPADRGGDQLQHPWLPRDRDEHHAPSRWAPAWSHCRSRTDRRRRSWPSRWPSAATASAWWSAATARWVRIASPSQAC